MSQPIAVLATFSAQEWNYSTDNLLAQVVLLPDQSTFNLLSGSQFFIALIAGVVMAFAFQVILTNFSIATGISAGINPAETGAQGWGKKIRRIEAKVGGWMVFVVNVALFVACFLAVKLTLIPNPELGAIIAVVIWSVYFLLLLWLSSRAVSSLAGAVGSTASSGLQGVIGTLATALSGRTAANQITDTVEASVAAVSKELKSAFASDQVRQNLEAYMAKLPQSRLQGLPEQATNALSNLPASSNFLDLFKSATPEDLSSGKLRQQLTQLLGVGTETNSDQNSQKQTGLRDRTLQLGLDTLVAILVGRNGSSNLDLENLTKPLTSLAQQFTQATSSVSNSIGETIRSDVENYLLNSPSWYLRPDSLDHGFREVLYDPEADAVLVQQQLEQLNRAAFVEILNQRQGIAAEQINDIADELELIRREVLDQVRVAAEQAQAQMLRQRVEAYLSSVPKEALMSQAEQDFAALLIDPEASYETLGTRLLQFDRDTLMQFLLAGRQDLSPEETEQILNTLESAREQVLNQSQATWSQLQTQAAEFRQRVESYLRETDPTQLTPQSIQRTLQSLLNAPEAGLLAVRASLGQIDRPQLEQVLTQRTELDQQQVQQILNQVETVRDTLLNTPQQLTEQAQQQYEKLTNQIGEYLRNTNLEELDPEGIQRDLGKLLNDPQAGAAALRSRLAQIDRETLVKLLSQRSDLNEEQVNQIIDRVQKAIRVVIRSPRQLVARTRNQARDLQTELAEYLRRTNRQELNPEGIKRDLQLLLKHPQVGAEQLADRFKKIDRDTLVSLLAQRQDVTEEEANRIVDQIESARDQIINQAETARNSVLQTVEQLQTEAEQRIVALKQNAKEQMEETQKTVATAAWWLFGTAITSVATAAIAGILASGGFRFLS
jgi:hypothetical protein